MRSNQIWIVGRLTLFGPLVTNILVREKVGIACHLQTRRAPKGRCRMNVRGADKRLMMRPSVSCRSLVNVTASRCKTLGCCDPTAVGSTFHLLIEWMNDMQIRMCHSTPFRFITVRFLLLQIIHVNFREFSLTFPFHLIHLMNRKIQSKFGKWKNVKIRRNFHFRHIHFRCGISWSCRRQWIVSHLLAHRMNNSFN